jgi:hypothetical protein
MSRRCKGKASLGSERKERSICQPERTRPLRAEATKPLTQNNLDALDEVIASDITDHDPAPGQGPGLEGVKQYFSSLHAAFPDVQ